MNQIKINIIKSITLISSMSLVGGILYIPLVIEQLGYWIGLLYIILGGIMVLILNLMLVEVSLRTSGTKSLIFMIHKYLGNFGKLVATFLVIFIGYFYGWILFDTASDILVNIFSLTQFTMNIVFLGIVFIFLYLKIHLNSNLQVFLLSIFIFLLLIISARILFINNLGSLEGVVNGYIFKINNLYIPLGGILFIYFNTLFIQEAEYILVNNKQFLKNIVVIANTLNILIYMGIILIIFFSKDYNLSQNFILGLKELVPVQIYTIFQSIIVGFILFIFIYLSQYLTTVYHEELNIKKNISMILSIVPFFGLSLINSIDSTQLIEYIGSLFISALSMLIILMVWQAKYRGDTVPEFSLGKMKLGGYLILWVLGLSIVGFILVK